MGKLLFSLVFALFSHTANAGLDADEAAPIKLHAMAISKCPCDGDCILDLEEMEMMMKEDNQLSFKSKMVIKENSCDKLSGVIQLKYCDKDGSNCFEQPPFEIKDLCPHLDDKDTIWETIISKLKELGFIPKCPIEKDTYEMDEVLVDMKPIEHYRPEPGRWWGTFNAKCEAKTIFCISIEILVAAIGLE